MNFTRLPAWSALRVFVCIVVKLESCGAVKLAMAVVRYAREG